MIINLPTGKDYTIVAKQCLTQAFNIIYEISKELSYLEDVQDVETARVWDYRLGDLSTSLVLVHQATEALMKATICDESPLLLLEYRRTDWPTMPDSENKDFNELFTVGGEALQRTFGAVKGSAHINKTLVEFIEEIRLKRNRIVHGISRQELHPDSLIRYILSTYTNFLGKDSWWQTRRDFRLHDPTFGSFDDEYETAYLYEELDYTEHVVGKAEFRRHFCMNLKTRRYYCPWCAVALAKQGETLYSKWAFLVPQEKSGATEIKCLNCQQTHVIIRERCSNQGCKGDVIYPIDDKTNECLTCGQQG